ncbi:hypothetical protein Tco_0203020 [Tanacetum coccineum]
MLRPWLILVTFSFVMLLCLVSPGRIVIPAGAHGVLLLPGIVTDYQQICDRKVSLNVLGGRTMLFCDTFCDDLVTVSTRWLLLVSLAAFMVPAGSLWFLLVGFMVPTGLLTISSASIV